MTTFTSLLVSIFLPSSIFIVLLLIIPLPSFIRKFINRNLIYVLSLDAFAGLTLNILLILASFISFIIQALHLYKLKDQQYINIIFINFNYLVHMDHILIIHVYNN